MSTGLKRGVWAALLLICLAVAAFALRGAFAFGEPPITPATPTPAAASSSAGPSSARAAVSSSAVPASTPAPSTSASTAASSTAAAPSSSEPVPASPSSEPAAASTASEPPSEEAAPEEPAEETAEEPPAEGSPTADEAAARMTGPAAPWEELTAAPEHIDVYADGELVIGAPVRLVQMQEDGELNPDPETVGWYGPPQWGTTPGETSRYPGVLTGHVRNYGGKDVFWNLQGLAAGALVVVTYDDGTQAAFRTDADAVSMDKDALTHDPAYVWAWELPEEGTKLTLITCDASSGPGAVGTSTNNWAVQATRVA